MHQSHKASSQKYSVQAQICKKPRSSVTQSVSKYFLKRQSHSELNDNYSLDSESPYKNTIRPPPLPQSNSLSDDDDFQQPKSTEKGSLKWALSKASKSQNLSTKRGKKKSKALPNSTLKIIEDNFKYQQENGDHLQMAIALSKSTYEEVNSGKSQDELTDISEIFTKQNTKLSVLEKYGFSSNHKSMPVTNRKRNLDIPSSKAKSRFKFITPILKIRTNEERQQLITSKISMILTEDFPKTITSFNSDNLSTFTLNCYTPKYTIFNFDSNNTKDFYVKDLDLLVSNRKSGHLLKNWSNIPGRDISPPRNLNDHKVLEDNIENEENAKPVSSPVRSLSPDLFGSEYESDTLLNYSLQRSKKNSITNKSTVLPTENDLNVTFNDNTQNESFKNNSNQVNENIIDLTDDNDIDIAVENIKRDPKFYCLSDFESDDENDISNNKRLTTINFQQPMSLSRSKLSQSPIKSSMMTITQDNNCHLSKTDNLKNIVALNYSSDSNDTFLNNKMESDSDIEVFSDDEHVGQMKSNLEDTPEKINQSLKHSIKYNDSSELNVTDYIKQLLNKEHFSFNKSDKSVNSSKINDTFLKDKGDTTTTSDHEDNVDDVDIITLVENEERIDDKFDQKYLNFGRDDRESLNNSKTNDSILCDKHSVTNYCDDNIDNQDCFKENNVNEEVNLSYTDDQQEHCANIIDLINNEEHMDDNYDDVNVDLQNTPKRYSRRMSKSLISHKSNLYNSCELNITDYVANLLANQLNDGESYGTNNLETANDQLSLSQESQKSVLADEELNYSSYFSKIEENIDVEEINQIKCTTPSKQKKLSINLGGIAKQLGPITPSRLIVKIEKVPPMPDYDGLSTPSLHKELAKYGIKPLKRPKGIKLLRHIYETTHPIINEQIVDESTDLSDDEKVMKKRKITVNTMKPSVYDNTDYQLIEIVGDSIIKNEKFEDLIFERKQSAKIPSCAVPLQIVWHNFVTSNPDIREHILLYEPLQLECLHMMLKEQGYKFHIQDLLTFLDKKCITIRTAQNQRRKN